MRCCFSGGRKLERLHVVEPVGELDDHDPHVLGHGHEHLPDVLGLLLLHRPGASELAQLGDAVDEPRDLAPEALLDLGDGEVGVLGDVVQQRGRQRLGVHLERGEVVGHGHRMSDVRPRPELRSWPSWAATAVSYARRISASSSVRPMASRLRDDLVDRVVRLAPGSPPRVIRCTTAAGEKRASCAMGA